MNHTAQQLMLYVQYALSEGLKPDANGIYSISRKEFLDNLKISASAFDRNKDGLIDAMSEWDLEIFFSLTGLLHQSLYVDVEYSNGALTFRRNPITLRPELSYVWGICPPYWEKRRFVYPYIPVPENVELPIQI